MKNKKTVKIIVVILVIAVISLLFYKYLGDKNYILKRDKYESIFLEQSADVIKYYIYGTHYNIEGNLKLENYSILDDVNYGLVLLDLDTKNETIIELQCEIKDNILNFKTSELLDDGIYLDSIQIAEYALYIKEINDTNKTIKYYGLKNMTNDGELEYYTITRNNSNNYIKIYFIDDDLYISCSSCELPENVYDIVIDQGHGGTSKGAVYNGYIEAEVNFDCGVKLKEELEKLGLKVLLTRTEKSQGVSEYGENGRAVIPHKVKAKYCFSIHNNASAYPERDGVEIYAPKFVNLDFAKSLADNIVSIADTTYSVNPVGKVQEGVYVLTFEQKNIDSTNEDAEKYGFEPYKLSTDTMYFFMIREVGGRLTGGYVDGRDKRLPGNPYWNSNNVAEAYLLELGYVSNKDDIKNVVDNMDNYIAAIVKSIKEKLLNV